MPRYAHCCALFYQMGRPSQFSCPHWTLRCENFVFVGVLVRRVALRCVQINRSSEGASMLF